MDKTRVSDHLYLTYKFIQLAMHVIQAESQSQTIASEDRCFRHRIAPVTWQMASMRLLIDDQESLCMQKTLSLVFDVQTDKHACYSFATTPMTITHIQASAQSIFVSSSIPILVMPSNAVARRSESKGAPALCARLSYHGQQQALILAGRMQFYAIARRCGVVPSIGLLMS